MAPPSTRPPVLAGLVTASHPGPAVAVTTVVALLAWSAGVTPARGAALVGAVLAGQLVIGWVNDLVDVERDRAVGRTDKPVAAGTVPVGLVRACAAVALVACVVLSLATGWRSGLVHLGLGVASGLAYDLGVKATALSPLPYAVAFGSLPVFTALAATDAALPPWWVVLAGACVGVGAHALDALPDLALDLRTGVRGLPHRLGARGSRVAAALLLGAASLLAALGPSGPPHPAAAAVLVAVAGCVVVALVGRGRAPFAAAVGIALLDVSLLVAA
nr:UbiA family prenyltransferase [Nocardioides perillae]